LLIRDLVLGSHGGFKWSPRLSAEADVKVTLLIESMIIYELRVQ